MKFKPSAGSTLVLAALAITFVVLGRWQLERAQYKAERERAFAEAPTRMSLEDRLDDFTRVELVGTLDPERHFLLDNRIHGGRPGVHVLTPFRTASGTLLVNRGWLPLTDRRKLPEVATEDARQTLTGHVRPFTLPGVQLGEADRLVADRWPQLLTYPRRENLARALGEPLAPWVLYLDATSPAGFEGRDWKPHTMGPDKHRGYAVQWFALAATAVGAWLVLGLRRARGTGEEAAL